MAVHMPRLGQALSPMGLSHWDIQAQGAEEGLSLPGGQHTSVLLLSISLVTSFTRNSHTSQ